MRVYCEQYSWFYIKSTGISSIIARWLSNGLHHGCTVKLHLAPFAKLDEEWEGGEPFVSNPKSENQRVKMIWKISLNIP